MDKNKITSINKSVRMEPMYTNVYQIAKNCAKQLEAVEIKSDLAKKAMSPINIAPYITLQEHKKDIVALAMAGGDPTDLYPVEAYCLPGEYQKILSWLKVFSTLWNSISVSQTVTDIFAKKKLEVLEFYNQPNYIHCCKVFKLLNESQVFPDSRNILFWQRYLQKYGAD